MLKLFLWLRYLRKKKIVSLSVAAVAVSVALLMVVASLFTGFIKAFEQSAVEVLGDVVLSPPVKFAKYPILIERLEQIGAVESATVVLSAEGLLHLGKGEGNVRAVHIWGIEPGGRARVTGLKEDLRRQRDLPGEPSFEVAGFPEKLGGFVGIGVVAEPDQETDEYDFVAVEDEIIGQEVILSTGAVTDTEGSSGAVERRVKRRSIRLTVVDIVFTGVYELDKRFVYLPIEELQRRIYPNEDRQLADQIQIKLARRVRADSALAQIRGVWEGFAADELGWGSYLIRETEIVTAKTMQSRYIAEIRKQMGVLLFIFGVVSCSVVVLVFCIFYMIVMTKQKDIAIIKSCGAASSSVALTFVGFGSCVGVIGSGIGTVLGYVITKNVNTLEEWIRIIFGLKLWKSSVYMFSKIPTEINWDSVVHIVLLAVIAATVGALIPAIIAVRTRPVDILRYE